MQPVLYILHAKSDVSHEVSLSQQLVVFEKFKKTIRVLRDRELLAGNASQEERQRAVDQADILVLLITPMFWSEYELALRGIAQNKRVVPVLVSSTPWTEAPFGCIRPLPSDEKFIEQAANKDAAWLDVAQGLMRVWESVAKVLTEAKALAEARAAAALDIEPPRLAPRQPPVPLAPDEKARVLFVAANPSATSRLQLAEEFHQIKERLLRAPQGKRIDLILEPELRLNDLASTLMRHRPHIVHFSGHGNIEGAILLVDPDKAGASRSLDPLALRELFHILNESVRCVILNSCHSAAKPRQAQALAEVVGCVIGMETSIADPSAIQFAASFYEALGFGRGLHEAFLLGKQAILAMGHPGPSTPQYYSDGTDDKFFCPAAEQTLAA